MKEHEKGMTKESQQARTAGKRTHRLKIQKGEANKKGARTNETTERNIKRTQTQADLEDRKKARQQESQNTIGNCGVLRHTEEGL